MCATERTDLRREGGARTRTRLMDAALDRLAARGEDGLTLREITDAAGANVSAVSYHFGSLKQLCDAAIEQALERYLDAQEDAVGALGPQPSIEQLAVAFARPMVRALAVGGRELDVIRVVARAGIAPPQSWARFDPSFERTRAVVIEILRSNLRGVRQDELVFRIRAAAGMLNWVALAPVGEMLRGKSEKQVERWLAPVLAGALAGISAS